MTLLLLHRLAPRFLPFKLPLFHRLVCFLMAEMNTHDGKRKCETLWPIFKVSHQKSWYVYDLYHRREEISKELNEFCLDQGYADRSLIAKWKKSGYERFVLLVVHKSKRPQLWNNMCMSCSQTLA